MPPKRRKTEGLEPPTPTQTEQPPGAPTDLAAEGADGRNSGGEDASRRTTQAALLQLSTGREQASESRSELEELSRTSDEEEEDRARASDARTTKRRRTTEPPRPKRTRAALLQPSTEAEQSSRDRVAAHPRRPLPKRRTHGRAAPDGAE